MTVYNPQFLTGNCHLPDRKSLTAMCRSLTAIEPIASIAIEFQSSYPVKFLQITHKCEDTSINELYDKQIEKLDLQSLIPNILKEYLTAGECYLYQEFDEWHQMWSDCIIQNPDYIIVKRNYEGNNEISLRPDERLRSLVLKTDPNETELIQISKLNNKIVNHIKNGENIPLDNFNVSAFIKKDNPYDVRGSSILLPVLKDFILLNKMRESNACLSDQKQIEQKIKDCIWHPDVISTPDSTIRIDMLRIRFQLIMELIVKWLETKIFSPVARINNFFEQTKSEKKYIIPQITFDSTKLIESLMQK